MDDNRRWGSNSLEYPLIAGHKIVRYSTDAIIVVVYDIRKKKMSFSHWRNVEG